ncbi:lymphocyte antigen 6H-like [Phyllostomus hastatus]|uniref:lymphocyte antigen 6H-like n=1 Tax=Phyllostomus hastatus TaxID=9423 RepID=UPI001E6824B8|nr:lymphocyte antigen 6H-like [Phyllostomus hastatus]
MGGAQRLEGAGGGRKWVVDISGPAGVGAHAAALKEAEASSEHSASAGTPLVAQNPGSMRGLHLVLLAVLLCSDRALSLQCYLCAGAQTTTQCPVMSCGQGPNVCYKSDLIVTWQDGRKVSVQHGGCAPSCEEASKLTQTVANPGPGLGPMNNILEEMGSLVPKFEVQGVSCCEKDLCNGVSRAGRSLWALAGGLLLSLGPALLWTLP